ncbi:hypothetical protein C9374_000488 [Naegleria lovaniensis]|uniref:E3 ubiquitin protein ligase n=1 Tax=Naegleria lovaniensis TaxID=51637 RepID=A0AA88GZ34_NAELO|nr:uncharacterized protein C9374_000488 [Naegleria lovaniensis]KAG2388324.1 hypothetical protein C9374_000488 [Naegleria lovaniensis]
MYKLKEKDIRKRKQDEINQGGSPKTNGSNTLQINTSNLQPQTPTETTPTSTVSGSFTPTLSTLSSSMPTFGSPSNDLPISPPTKKTKFSDQEIHDLKLVNEQRKRLLLKNKELTRLNDQYHKEAAESARQRDIAHSNMARLLRQFNHMIEDVTLQLSRLPAVPNGRVGEDVFAKVYDTSVDEESINQLFERFRSILSRIVHAIDVLKEEKSTNNEKQLEEGLRKLNSQYREMKDDYNALNERLQQSEQLITTLKQQVEDKEEDLKSTKNKIEKLSYEKEELLTSTPLATPISPFTSPTKIFPSTSFDNLPQDDTKLLIAQREEEINEYVQRYSRANALNEELKAKVEELESKIKNLTLEIDFYKDSLQKEKLRLEAHYEKYNAEVERNKLNLKNLEDTYNSFKEKMKQDFVEVKNENKQLKDTIEKLNREKSENSLLKQNEQLLQKKKEQVEKYNKLKYRYEKAKQAAEEAKVYKQDKEEIIRQLNMYKKRNEELAKQISSEASKESASTSEGASKESTSTSEEDPSFLKSEIIKWKEQSEMFEASLNDTIQAYEKLQQEKDEVTKRVDRAEEQRLESMKEKAKMEKIMESVKDDLKKISETCTELERAKKQQEERIQSLALEKSALSEFIEKQKLEEIIYRKTLDQQRQVLDHYKLAVPSLHSEIELLKTKNTQLIQDLEKKENECNKQSLAIKRLNEEKQRKKEAEIASASTDDYFKRKITCTQCNDREVDHVICRCFHTFCKECVNLNIKTRNRKCPKCGVRYDQNDVKQFYLN